MSDTKLGMCAHGGKAHVKWHQKYLECVNWREQPAQHEPDCLYSVGHPEDCTCGVVEQAAQAEPPLEQVALRDSARRWQGVSPMAGPVEGMSAPTDEWAEALSVEIQQCITRDGEEDPNGSIAELLLKRVAPLAEVRELREERDALKAHNEELMQQNATECQRAERAESALREARNTLDELFTVTRASLGCYCGHASIPDGELCTYHKVKLALKDKS